VFYVVALFIALQNTEKVMHPPSPMLESNAWRIQLYFFSLTALAALAAWQIARWLREVEQRSLAE
jgi:membrane protein implicated in regulation of membrane protease activity